MNKCGFLAFCVSMFLGASLPAQAAAQFSYGENTFIAADNCLGIYPGPSLTPGEKVWIFSTGMSPRLGSVDHIISAAEAKKRFDGLGFDKVWADKKLWVEIGCIYPFRGDMPESVARVGPDPEDGAVGFAIRGLPAEALIAGGKGESVPMSLKDNPYVDAVQPLVTTACYAPDSLVRVRRFPIREGRTIVQLDIGKIKEVSAEAKKRKIEEEMQRAESGYAKWAWPEYKKKTLEKLERKVFVESVEICRFFLDEKRVLKAEKISRRTGEEERVDTPVDLDGGNWAETTNSAIGFISLDEGKNWDVLLVDVGFEGINYAIQRLDGSAVYYRRSLYTDH